VTSNRQAFCTPPDLRRLCPSPVFSRGSALFPALSALHEKRTSLFPATYALFGNPDDSNSTVFNCFRALSRNDWGVVRLPDVQTFGLLDFQALSKSFGITSFADPHPLTPLFAHLSEKVGGGGWNYDKLFPVVITRLRVSPLRRDERNRITRTPAAAGASRFQFPQSEHAPRLADKRAKAGAGVRQV